MKTDTSKPRKLKLSKAERAARQEAARHLLAEARDGGSLVVVRRRFKGAGDKKAYTTRMGGYVVGLSSAWALLHEVNRDTLTFNGYRAVRVSDITEAWRDTSFIGEYLRQTEQMPVALPDVLLADLPGLLSSVNGLYPLLRLGCERTEPDRCLVGRMGRMGQVQFDLLPVGGGGRWLATERLRYEDVTSVQFGAGYEQGLWQMAQEEWPRRAAYERKERSK